MRGQRTVADLIDTRELKTKGLQIIRQFFPEEVKQELRRRALRTSLKARGFEVHATALDEFERADGSPTCLSLLVEPVASYPRH